MTTTLVQNCSKECLVTKVKIDVGVENLDQLRYIEMNITNNGRPIMADVLRPEYFIDGVLNHTYPLKDLPQNAQLLATYRFYSYDGSWVEYEKEIK